jgi:acyl-CoA thioesterase
MGAVMAGWRSTQASAIWAGGRSRAFASASVASITRASASWSRVDAHHGVGSGAGGGFAAWAGEEAAGERRPGDDADAGLQAQRQHLALFFAVQQVVLRLHGDEALAAGALGGVLHGKEAPRGHGRGAEVADLAGADEAVERVHGFGDGHIGVEAVDLQQVDVVRAEPPQAVVGGLEDGLAAEAAGVGAARPREVELGGDHHLVAARHAGERPTGDLLRCAIRIAVRRVEEVDAGVQRLGDEGAARLLRQRPGVLAALQVAEAHAAQAEARHGEAGAAEACVVHGVLPLSQARRVGRAAPRPSGGDGHGLAELIGGLETVEGGIALDLPEDWAQGRTAYGGLTAALCVEAAGRAHDLPPLRAAQVAFVGPASGRLVARASLLRRGRSAAVVEAAVDGERGPATRAILTYGAPRESAVSHTLMPMPDVPGPEDSEDFFVFGPGPRFARNFEVRIAAGRRPLAGGDPDFTLWVRHRGADGVRADTALVALGDAPPPAAMIQFAGPAPISSMTWSLDVLALSEPGAWHLLRSASEWAADGYSAQAMAMWARDGSPVAVGRQTVAIFA